MDENQFWNTIEKSRKGFFGDTSKKTQAANLKKILTSLSLEEVIAFDKIFDLKLAAAYTWDLWGAAYIIDGGCSDDAFEYFRRGLIAAGREKYQAAMHDVQSLSDWAKPDELEFEEIKYVVYDVYNEKTGTKELPDHGLKYPSTPSGEEWEEDGNDLEERFPRLWAKFGA